MTLQLESRYIQRARHRIVHEGSGQQLPAVVINHLLHERLTDALHYAAVELAGDNHRIDHRTEIIDAAILYHFDGAGVRIDLDLGDMTAIRKGPSAGAVADMNDVERLRSVGGQVKAAVQFLRELHDRNRTVGADDNEFAMLERDVGRSGFEHIACEMLAPFDNLGSAFNDRGAAVHDRFRAAGPAADDNAVAVALHERDFVERDAELLTQDLRERRRMPHAEIERAGGQRHRAVGIENNARGFLCRPRGDFKVAADT